MMMKLRKLPSRLLSTSSLLFYLINLCNSAAPADLPSDCPTLAEFPTNQRVLLDSCCYSTLLPGPWISIPESAWMDEATGDSRCPQRVMVSNAVDTWLITQYINTTLSSGRSASGVEVDIQFTCTGDCSTNPRLLYYQTNTEQNLTALPSNSFALIGQVVNGSNPVTGITTAGFYLSIQATGSISVIIHRISVIATFCRGQTVNLISFPEAYPTTASEAGSCSIANSEPMGGGALTGTCGNNGNWTTSSSCVCSAGYFLDNGACTACPVRSYKSTAGNELCSPCPQNSDTTSTGSTICPCQSNYMRPNSNAAAEDCSECVENFFLGAGGSCESCPRNSRSSGGSASMCNCIENHTTMDGSPMTTGENCVCGENYHIDSSSQCVQCPANSLRTITSAPSVCMCESNRATADGNITTSGSVTCNGCQPGHFLMRSSGECMVCPENSNNTRPLSESCICNGRSVTMAQSATTNIEDCSSCRENFRTMSSSPLVCEECPPRSERPIRQNLTNCTCEGNYEMKSSMCLARVIIPQEPMTVKEGSVENPANITLMLSANSYGFSVVISIEPMHPDLPRSVEFAVGTTNASLKIPGNDVALNESSNLMVTVNSHNDYIGEGEFAVTIVDDDPVSVGFLDSQRKEFNETEGTINIVLTKNVTTAQDIQVNLVLNPGGGSIGTLPNPVTLKAGPSRSFTVMLSVQDDSIGGENDESVVLTLELVSPMDLSHLIDLNPGDSGVTSRLEIIIKDDDEAPGPRTDLVLDLPTIIGIAVAGAAVLILIFLILLVSICICRFNASRQGFYTTDEDKAANPPSMLRYSASLRSISSQAVVPIIDGKGQLTEKENEFYV